MLRRYFLLVWSSALLLHGADQPEGPWKATLPYFAPPPGAGQDKAQITAAVRDRFRIQGDCGCRILIATVPDPVNSRLGLFFDRSVESIQRAAEDSDWEFDRQWMPWSDRVTVETNGPEKYYSQRALLEARQQQPGVLVFRAHSDGKTPSLLLILLVAETPVGVNPIQFQNALDDASVLSSSKQVEIVGPSFSGSFPSLQRLITQHWAFPEKAFRIRSGTATSQPYAARLIKALGPSGSFRSAVDDSGAVVDLLDSRLGDLNSNRAHTAILVEDESGFGNTVVTKLHAERGPDSVLTIRFPREIAAVRNAYQEAVQTTPNAKDPAPTQPLAFSLRDPQTGDDSVPIFAKAHTPLAQNAVISEIATTLKRDHIRLAEIVATNVLDTLFLVRILRAACPDVRLLIPTADLLFVQAEMQEPMSGTLVISNYPLFWPNQKWTESSGHPVGRVVFSDSNSQGVYNATRILLQPDGHASGLAEYLSPLPGHGSDTHPPMWLLEVTSSGLWPIRVFDRSMKDAEASSRWFDNVTAPGSLPGLSVEPPSKVWNTLALFTALAGLLFATSVWVAQHPFAPRPLYILALAEGDGSVPIRALYLLTLSFCLMVLLVTVGVPSVQFFRQANALAEFGAIHILLLLSLLSLIATIVFTLRRLHGLEARSIGATTIVLSTIILSLFFASCSASADGVGSFFVFRSLHPSSGVSPLVPSSILIVGCGLFVWAHLKRTVFAVERKPLLPTEHFDEYAEIHLEESLSRLNRSFEAFFPAPIHSIGGSVSLACVLLLIDPRQFLFVIEPAPFRFLLVTLFIVLLTFVMGTLMRFVISWSTLKELLTRTDRLRLGGAFRRLPREYSGEPIWQQQIRLRTYSTMSRGAECLDVLAALGENALRTGGIDPSALAKQRTSLRAAINAIFAAEAAGRSETFKQAQSARELADSCANYLAGAVLVPAWKKGVVDVDNETEDDLARSAIASKLSEDPVYRLAAEFVALRFASYIRYALLQLRNLLGFISGGFAFLAATLLTYPFQAPQTIRWVLTLTFLVIGIPAVLILTQMSRNPVLRRLASQKEGSVDTGLFRKVAYFGSLPLLGVLSAQFPSLSRWIGSWLQPTLEALR